MIRPRTGDAAPHGLMATLLVASLLLLLAFPVRLAAQAHRIASPSPGLIEAGVPSYNIRGMAVIGLESRPSDLKVLPDGRLLLLAGRAIALGDGIRWDVYQLADDDLKIIGTSVAVDADGEIYIGMQGGFAKVHFEPSGKWRGAYADTWLAVQHGNDPVPRSVVVCGDRWYWHAGSGDVVEWKPGGKARVVGGADAIEHIFTLDGRDYLSERTTGRLFPISNGRRLEAAEFAPVISPNLAVTSAVSLDATTALVGTYGRGVRVFDGREMRPFAEGGILGGNCRVNSLCLTEGSLYAAAIENLGIVFFRRDGSVVEALDKSVDGRLAHVRKLAVTRGGLVWGLLDDGLVRVEFPSRLTQLDPLVGSGVASAHPYRLDGRLWLLADGRVLRGSYDAYGRLTGFEPDTPEDRFAYTLAIVGGRLVAGTERGAYVRTESGWKVFAPDTVNLRVLGGPSAGGPWLYSAHGKIGYLRPGPDGLSTESWDAPHLDNVFDALRDREGAYWLELGNAEVARVVERAGAPAVEVFGAAEGVPSGWVQIFCLEGVVRFNVGDEILRFDETRRRFVKDAEFSGLVGKLGGIVGRPSIDATGRLWISAEDRVHVLARAKDRWVSTGAAMPAGFLPYYFTFEPDGVVWMHSERRLARYDPRVPEPLPAPLKALVTSVSLPGSERSRVPLRGLLGPLDYGNNSLVFHFVAVGNIARPVAFDVMLEGGEKGWMSVDSSGSAAFNRLPEGRYVLHVRPRVGARAGEAAQVAFEIRPPWFRSSYAYGAYLLAVLAGLFAAIRVPIYLQRLEKRRLEQLVAQRTAELAESKARLEAQVQEIRRLSQAIEQTPVGVVLATPDGEILYANRRYCETRGCGGSLPVGRNLRDVAQADQPPPLGPEVLAALEKGGFWQGQVAARRRDGGALALRTTVSPIRGPAGETSALLVLEEDISEWTAEQERRRRLEGQLFKAQKLESIGTLAGGIAHDFNNILTGILGFCELASLSPGLRPEVGEALAQIRTGGLRARDLVSQILTFSRKSFARLEPIELSRVVGDAVKLVRASTPSSIELVTALQPCVVRGNAGQVHQVVVNLATNSIQAMDRSSGRLSIGVTIVGADAELASELRMEAGDPCACLSVADTGRGMDQSTMDRMFDPFFTTKGPGEGTGLGLSLVQGIVTSHGGALRVSSAVGKGTQFDVFLPLCGESVASPRPEAAAPHGAGEEVLVVDDEPAIRLMISGRLTRLGYRPSVFADPRQARDAFAAEPDRFAAIVTDLTMPHMSGAELVAALKALRPGIPAIVMTGHSEESVGRQLSRMPRCVVLQKPFESADLARLLEQLVRGKGQGARDAKA